MAGTADHQHLVTAELCMADNVHRRVTRKRVTFDTAKNAAAVNRLAHGRFIADGTAAQSRRAQARKSLDRHRNESGEGL